MQQMSLCFFLNFYLCTLPVTVLFSEADESRGPQVARMEMIFKEREG
jgi:hypothetical protein